MRYPRGLTWCWLAVLTLAGGCSDEPPPGAGEVFVSIPPQATFAERIAGDRATVTVLLSGGDSPATYSPSMKQMVALDNAVLYFRIGVPFENALVGKIDTADGRPRIVDVTDGIDKRRMKTGHEPHAGDHDHHDHAGAPDPHVWLSPRRVKTIAANMAEALIAVDAEHAEYYRRNLRDLQADLDALDRELSETFAPVAGQKMYVYHPAFGYLAEDYGLEQVAVELEGKEPAKKRVAALADRAAREGVRVIFVQPQFSDRAARALAEAVEQRRRQQGRPASVAVVALDPLAGDYFANMRRMARRIRDALTAPPGGA
ncbi:MAG: metal ABC transporter solute-binding protein, Zn/Mn family [Planctomycetota bacterium]